MRRWKGWITVGVLALVVGAVLVAHPWREPEIRAASQYSSPGDLARDLNEHGLGCASPTRRETLLSRKIDFSPLVECSVVGQPVVLGVVPPEFLAAWVREFYPGVHYTNLQDLADAHAQEGAARLREVSGIDAILIGPNWTVTGPGYQDSVPALSAIRAAIGGTLLVAPPSSSTPSSPSMSGGPSI